MEAVEIVRRFYAEIWNEGDLDAIPDICHEGIVFRGSLGDSKVGHQGFADYVRYVRGALAGYRCYIEETVCEGERAFAKMLFAGRHEKEFQGYAATGKMLEWAGAALFTIEDGRIAELWVLGDVHGLRTQLSANAETRPSSPA
jgi:steroid delta-isomerase-like uncharacterized protein